MGRRESTKLIAMTRADLLALTPDDLAAMTNRGTVKRAQKELDAGKTSWKISDTDDGDLIVTWSDGISCRFPDGMTVHDAVCSSGLAGISRHIVRSVLAYQRTARDGTPAVGEEIDPQDKGPHAEEVRGPGGEIWDPGAFTDDDLVACFRRAAVTKARRRFEQGVLVELTRGVKPTARFLDEACTVRFLVPGDLRYVTADCAKSLLPTWVPLAVWAFRQLPADRIAGLLCIQHQDLPTPTDLLDNLDVLLDELLRDGMTGLAKTWSQRLKRSEKALRDAGLVWPAELILDLLHQQEMYAEHDARFEPLQLIQLVGELIARTRAIASRTREVPQILIRGSKSDRPTDIAGGRMVGVGLGVRPGKHHATLSAYLHDTDTGSVAAVERTFADPDPESGDEPRSFTDLGATVLARGVSLAGLASSQLLLKSGKRTPSGQLILPRTAGSLSINPQRFQWEQLKPPFAAESLAQLTARFEVLPPSYLRPRRRTENLHVVAVQGTEDPGFDEVQQCVTAVLRDPYGDTAQLVHPFHARGREGFNDLLEVLEKRGHQVRFVCGHFRPTGRGLEIRPIQLILDNGEHRAGVQPWVQNSIDKIDVAERSLVQDAAERSPVEQFIMELQESLAGLLLAGLRGCDQTLWDVQADTVRRIGFVRLANQVAYLTEALNCRSNSIRWDSRNALRYAKVLCLFCRVAAE